MALPREYPLIVAFRGDRYKEKDLGHRSTSRRRGFQRRARLHAGPAQGGPATAMAATIANKTRRTGIDMAFLLG
jgi:hypothetical protein